MFILLHLLYSGLDIIINNISIFFFCANNFYSTLLIWIHSWFKLILIVHKFYQCSFSSVSMLISKVEGSCGQWLRSRALKVSNMRPLKHYICTLTKQLTIFLNDVRHIACLLDKYKNINNNNFKLLCTSLEVNFPVIYYQIWIIIVKFFIYTDFNINVLEIQDKPGLIILRLE